MQRGAHKSISMSDRRRRCAFKGLFVQSPLPAFADETDRLSALRAYGILRTEAEAAFDEIVDLASRLCDAPIALISLVDEEEQWFKARVGLDVCTTPRDVSFCDHAMRGAAVMVVPDAKLDLRFSDNSLVTGAPHIRFYAGAPLVSADGYPMGALCVIDTRPRPDGLSDLQAHALSVLANQVMTQLELRKALKTGRSTGDRLADSEARFQAIADSMPQMVWSALPDGRHDYFNARWYEFTGVPQGSTDGAGWNDMFHPDDQERARLRWAESLETGELYEIEYRLRRQDGVYRWALGRATPIRDADGRITRWFGTCTDVDELKRMEQSKELVSQELSHRIKNIFAVVSSLIALSARQFPESRTFASVLRTRIKALSQAHEFVRPHSHVSAPSMADTTLHAFLATLFRPYTRPDGDPSVIISGDDTVFDDQAATSVALLFHELATNASKYGALSVEGGQVDLITRREDDRFTLEWIEQGGPPIHGEPKRQGFGSALTSLSVEGQLGGALRREWRPEGLRVFASLPATALSRRRAALNVA
jgi:PAS domain S-box-containing protein